MAGAASLILTNGTVRTMAGPIASAVACAGERILAPVVRQPEVLAAIRSHHERLDGQGYPDGLRDTAIPRLARLIAIVDCFDALTSSRAYRAAVSVPAALELLQAGAGTQFEPGFVRAFVKASAYILAGTEPAALPACPLPPAAARPSLV